MIDLLCADPWLCNMGDVATALATANGLAERGIPVSRVPVYRNRQTIIGGGDLIGIHAHGHLYHPRGAHILNAVGVRAETGDRSHLDDYRYLSVRDYESANRLGLPDVQVVPCPATLLNPIPWNLACSIPRWGLLQHQRDYIVVHARPELSGIANGSRYDDVIAIEPAPYTWHPWEAHGWMLPMTHSPQAVMAVLANARAVITLSLHLSILALASGTPFCIPARGNSEQIAKCRDYWTRAGIPEVICTKGRPVTHALGLRDRLTKVRETERAAAQEHLDRLASVCRSPIPDQTTQR